MDNPEPESLGHFLVGGFPDLNRHFQGVTTWRAEVAMKSAPKLPVISVDRIILVEGFIYYPGSQGDN